MAATAGSGLSKGNRVAYVVKSRSELFPGQSPAFSQRYSRTLVDGWYVDTNLNK